MRKKLIGCLAGLLTIFFWLPANAGTLQEDHAALELKRKALEKTRREYEVRLRTLSAQRYSLSLDLNKCVADKNIPSWEDRLGQAKTKGDQLEKERADLVNLRIDLDRVRNDHETRRAAIESKYRGKPRGESYEAELRQYMEKLESDYFDRIEKELFYGYKEYLSGVDGFLLFMGDFINECRARPKGESSKAGSHPKPAISGKLEMNVKISAIPTDAETMSDGQREFVVNTGGQVVRISVPPETWHKLEKAEKTSGWPATFSGEIGKKIAGGFEMLNPHIAISGEQM